jgi:MFS family permease
VAVLFFAQAVLGSQLQINIILGGLAGAFLANNAAFATLPISLIMLTAMFGAPLASHIMGRFGRRVGFLIGAAGGGIGGALAATALMIGRFDLLLLGAGLTGLYYSFHGFYRFAAADTASPAFRPKAISWVLAGGLVGAILGSEVVKVSSELLSPIPFAGAYLVVVLLNITGAIGIAFLDIPLPPRGSKDKPAGRPLGEIVCQPETVVAVLCAMMSYGTMVLVMTSTTLAMVEHGFTTNHAADVIRWHALAMFGPSFVTGNIIARFGHLPVMSFGLVLLGMCCVIALVGVGLENFYIALIMLGLGWNFSFIAATGLLSNTHSASERAKVQGLNDFLVLGTVSLASLSSGALLNLFGWPAVQLAAAPALVIAACALVWLGVSKRRGTFVTVSEQ